MRRRTNQTNASPHNSHLPNTLLTSVQSTPPPPAVFCAREGCERRAIASARSGGVKSREVVRRGVSGNE